MSFPVITGFGCATALPCVSDSYLKTPKSRKFMGGQDHLAVCAAGRALESAGLRSPELGSDAGLFLAVGYIPFEHPDIEALIDGSLEHGKISMQRFGNDGFAAVNPLLTFRCLPNMPAYHVSANFDFQGEYFVTYPGCGQFYAALQEAIAALVAGRIRVACVGAVAHQINFLVTHHYQRLRPPVAADRLRDGAAFIILEMNETCEVRGGNVRGYLKELSVEYALHDPFREELEPKEMLSADYPIPDGKYGAASLPVALASISKGIVKHEIQTRDGITASSLWELN